VTNTRLTGVMNAAVLFCLRVHEEGWPIYSKSTVCRVDKITLFETKKNTELACVCSAEFNLTVR